MNNAKRDFLKECMTEIGAIGKTPIDEFNNNWCRLCGQRECARSALNNSVFDNRVKNWKKNLFDEVPRALASDGRYDNIRSKNFLPVTTNDMAVVPNAIYEIKSEPDIKSETTQILPQVVLGQPEAGKNYILEQPKLEMGNEESKQKTKIQPNVNNTPFSQGQMIKPENEDVVLQPGGSFTFEEE